MYSLGYDVGSSSIKAAIIEIESGKLIASDFYPKEEMKINSPKPGWAEQDPETWWDYIKLLTKKLLKENNLNGTEIKCIGISYQMHGLVCVDENKNVIRSSIIWCDSRAVEIGDKAFNSLGEEYCLKHLLNSPGNFTLTKLKWVKENEPENYKKIYKIMLPGDYVAMKLTGEIMTTVSGLSEGIIWDFSEKAISKELLNTLGIDENIIAPAKNTFSLQGTVTKKVAEELGFQQGIPVAYRAGDQPNNAFSLNVLNPGEIAATAGTSGVVYGVIGNVNYDKYSRVNPFIHVNNTETEDRLGVLLCINGTGILNSWLRRSLGNLPYEEMNKIAAGINIGSDGVIILPFGNGAERVLKNKNIGCQILNVDFNTHSKAHLFRAGQEGIAFGFKYGIDIMEAMGLQIKVIRAGKANMFLSDVFAQTLSNISGAVIELYNTDGAQGAARGAAVGAGYYKSFSDAFDSLEKLQVYSPVENDTAATKEAYEKWLGKLNLFI